MGRHDLNTFRVGCSYFSAHNYCEYVPGDLPIIVVTPHGGYLRPDGLPPLPGKKRGNDNKSQEYARGLVDELLALTGKRAHLIVNHVHTTLLNPARSKELATAGHPVAGEVWDQFHFFIRAAKAKVAAEWGCGHYIECHTTGHKTGRVEVGLGVSPRKLNRLNVILSNVDGKQKAAASGWTRRREENRSKAGGAIDENLSLRQHTEEVLEMARGSTIRHLAFRQGQTQVQARDDGEQQSSLQLNPTASANPNVSANAGPSASASVSVVDANYKAAERFVELVRGPTSLGGLLAARSYDAIPSPSIPAPGQGRYFFSGWNCWAHGSKVRCIRRMLWSNS